MNLPRPDPSSGRDSIYLDHCATTPLCPEAAAAMAECQARAFGNPSSQHAAGRAARKALEDAREEIAGLLGAELSGPQPDRLIFTSGGTEANNLAILGRAGETAGSILVSRLEHPSVAAAAAELEGHRWRLVRWPVGTAGIVELAALSEMTSGNGPRLAALMLGSHETGILQPVAAAGAVCRAAGIGLHCDAVQAAGKIPVSFRALGADTLSVAAHKFHGPRGVGALLVRHGVELAPVLRGGPQESALRPGTEPVVLAVGMLQALRLCTADIEAEGRRLAALRDRFEAGLLAAGLGVVVHGAAAPRLPQVSSVAFPGLDRQALLVALDLAGVACSAGAACASGSPEPSPALGAMGLPDEIVQSSLRFSFGRGNTPAEIDHAVARIAAVCRRIAGQGRQPDR